MTGEYPLTQAGNIPPGMVLVHNNVRPAGRQGARRTSGCSPQTTRGFRMRLWMGAKRRPLSNAPAGGGDLMGGSVIRRGRIVTMSRPPMAAQQRWRGGFKTKREAERELADGPHRKRWLCRAATAHIRRLPDRPVATVDPGEHPTVDADPLRARRREQARPGALGAVPLQRLTRAHLDGLYAELLERGLSPPRFVTATHNSPFPAP